MPEIKIVQETSIYSIFSFIFHYHLTAFGYYSIPSLCLLSFLHEQTHIPPSPEFTSGYITCIIWATLLGYDKKFLY